MKKIVICFAIVFAVMLSGCAKEIESLSEQKNEMVLVNLDLVGEVYEDETPLTRSFTSNDLIGVQVYQDLEPYAYGLFDDVSKIKLFLHTGKKYRFVCTVVKNGKGIVVKGDNISSANYVDFALPNDRAVSYALSEGKYGLPFLVYRPGPLDSYNYSIPTYANGDGAGLSNSFAYSSDLYFPCLTFGTITLGDYKTNKNFPQADRFYGWVDNYSATKNGTLSIPMKRVGFGLTLSVSGITDGSVNVTIKNSAQTFANNTGITTDKQFGTTTWSFFDLANVYKYADNYAENFTVGVVWNRGVGVTQNLGTKTVQFKRNAVNHVKIKLTTTTRSSDSQMALEEPEITNETYSFGD